VVIAGIRSVQLEVLVHAKARVQRGNAQTATIGRIQSDPNWTADADKYS